MDSSSFASTLFVDDEVRLLTCIRSLYRTLGYATLMGYPRTGSLLLYRALTRSAVDGVCQRRFDLLAINQNALQS